MGGSAMKKRISSDDVFMISDQFSVPLVRDKAKERDQIKGRGHVDLNVLRGLKFGLDLKVVDSGFYDTSGYVGVLMHVCGAMYAAMLVSANDADNSEYCQLWLIDQSKLTDKSMRVFPTGWSRILFYRAIVEGVVCGYRRSADIKSKWVVVEESQKELRDYISLKLAEASAQGTELDLITFSDGTGHRLGDKFRTKGPRDL